ncbi:hypothetical protein BX616_005873 [Lobosporangium transversale]|uniref:Uncharacterized protein n=1 Tax=Lobosporangium transversale TaxID=64571 RepID=A0A1Y2GGM8_9FUNG|nr:hypothetical protein BCR41DRAFT_424501 [Lobosporangium transversale]KAF9915557.1 hypothetical protein BX616_005873 [Lobosporangium transversale]ORZ08543.1 hypothetical protein BCR41DRAFT_424501 [Lobosporangium transversale]|eukprot:XP_021878471.1 hypothetical protein BCR41DRAFT_424501 [Lobosporangium transversale]
MVNSETEQLWKTQDAKAGLQVSSIQDGPSAADTKLSEPPRLSWLPLGTVGYNAYDKELENLDDLQGTAAMALTALSSGMGTAPRHGSGLTMIKDGTYYDDIQQDQSIVTATPEWNSVKLSQDVNTVTSMVTTSSPAPHSTSVALMVHDEQGPRSASDREKASAASVPKARSGDVEIIAAAETQVDFIPIAGSIQPKEHDFNPATTSAMTAYASSPPPPIAVAPTFSNVPNVAMSSLSSNIYASAVQAPVKRTQSLSHLLEDRLSLEPMKAGQVRKMFHSEHGYWAGHSYNGGEQVSVRTVDERSLQAQINSSRTNHQQDFHKTYLHSTNMAYHQNASPLNLRPFTRGETQYAQEWDLERQSQRQESYQPSVQHEQSHHSKDIVLTHLVHHSAPLEAAIVKPKRKYIKKPSTLQLMVQTSSQAKISPLAKQEDDPLLQSDRGLILKTQIPKKGRPISKHASTSQGTPAVPSFGATPMSHSSFNPKAKTSVPASVNSPNTKQQFELNYHYHHQQSPPIPALAGAKIRLPSDDSHLLAPSPVRCRPGRPPLATVARHTHSQSHLGLQSGLLSMSDSDSHLLLSKPFPTPSPEDSAITRRTIASDHDPHDWPRPPHSAPSSFSAQRTQCSRHSYPSSDNQYNHTLAIQYHDTQSLMESEQLRGGRFIQEPHQSRGPPSWQQRSFGGKPMQMNSRKRNIYGAEKQQFMSEPYSPEDEKREMCSIYTLVDYDESGRFRKRSSRLDLKPPNPESNFREQDTFQSWPSNDSSKRRPRPQSLVLPRTYSDPLHRQSAITMALERGSTEHYISKDMARIEDRDLAIYESRVQSSPTLPRLSCARLLGADRSSHTNAQSLDISMHPRFASSQPLRQYQEQYPSGHVVHSFHDMLNEQLGYSRSKS